MSFEWDNNMMGLRDETRVEGVLIQTNFGMVLHQKRNPDWLQPESGGVVVRRGLRVLAVIPREDE